MKFCYEQDNGECGVNPSSIIWVKVPKIPAKSDTVIYIEKTEENYAVSGDQVFDFYDGFSKFNTDVWTVHGNPNRILAQSGILKIFVSKDQGHGIGTTTNFIHKDIIIEIKWKINGGQVDFIFRADKSGTWNRYQFTYEKHAGKDDIFFGKMIGHSFEYVKAFRYTTWEYNQWYWTKIIIKDNTFCVSDQEHILNCISDYDIPAVNTQKTLILSTWWDKPVSRTLELDWIRVRKYADIEPTITIEKAQALKPKPKLKLIINCDSLLKQGEIRTAELTIENVGNANAKDVMVTIFSSSLDINIQKRYDLIPPKEARTLTFKVAPNEAGKYTVKAKVEYWDDRGNRYIDTTEKTITVEATEIITEITSKTSKSVSTPDFTVSTLVTSLAIVLALRRLR